MKSQGNIYLLWVLLVPLNQVSGAASPLYSIVPLLVVLSFLALPHPLYFFSHSIQTFQGERPFPLCRTELPFCSAS